MIRYKNAFAALITTIVMLFALVDFALATKVEITVNKVSQKMTVRIDGATEYVWPVSTGRSGYETPSGKYRAFRMEEDHFSKEWDDAPMPHSIFFTGEGHAIHGTQYQKSLGRRASHGCVRLSEQNAATLYAIVEDYGLGNTSVVVKGGFFDFSFGGDEPASKPFAIQKKNGVTIFASGGSKKPVKGKKKRKIGFFSNL
jgi:hypothetical protein